MPVKFIKKLKFLFEPARLKIAYGGRGGGKTEGMATAASLYAANKKIRILCCREFQNSIAQSSYQAIVSAANSVNLSTRETELAEYEDIKRQAEFEANRKLVDEFSILKTSITTSTGSEFLFAGLRHNIESIKSLAKIGICWTDEARPVSKISLDKLGPTIRGRHESDPEGMGGPFGLGPELWFSFNPELDGDEIYNRYVVKREQYAPDFIASEVSLEDRQFYYSIYDKLYDEDLKLTDLDISDEDKARYQRIRAKRYAFVVKINYTDNPFLPRDLQRDIELAKEANEDDYLHTWEGNTKQVLDGAIYAEEIKQVIKDKRRGIVKYDPTRPVHTFWDLGHDDYTSIWFVQRVGVHYNLIRFYQNRLKKIPFYIEQLQSFGYNYGFHYLPHDADSETLASRSVAKLLRDKYPKSVKIVPRVPKKVVGIRAGRMVFDLCNFDEEHTADGWQCLCNYQYEVNEDNGRFSKDPVHNEFSHGADAFQTFALSLKSETAMKKETPKTQDTTAGARVVPFRQQSTGWMGG